MSALRLSRQLILEQERRHACERMALTGREEERDDELDHAIGDNLGAMRIEARWALACWRPVAGQVRMLAEQVSKKEHVRLILDAGAVDLQMGYRGVPNSARARVWDLVSLLHDLEAHDGRGYPICYSHCCEERMLDADCNSCRAWLRREGLSRGAS